MAVANILNAEPLGACLAQDRVMMFTVIVRWTRRQRMRCSLLLQLGPRTVAAYGKIVYAVVTERLWLVPPRSRNPGTDRTCHHPMGKAT